MKTIRERELEGHVITAPVGIDAIRECLDPFATLKAQARLARRRMPEYLELYRPQHRFAAYWQIAHMLDEPYRACLLRNVWGYDREPSVNEDAWRHELQMCARNSQAFMSAEDRVTFESLPLSITIYRAPRVDELVPRGFSWTFDRDWADMFSFLVAEGKNDDRYVFQAECEPHKAAAFILDQDANAELVIFPENIGQWERIPARPWERYEYDGREYLRRQA